MVGRGGEVERLARCRNAVVAWTLQAQRALKVQELAHEVEVRGNVGLFPLDEVVRVVERQVELLHQVGHRYCYRATDAGQAVDQDATLLRPSLICKRKGKLQSAES